ncbi:MULTISPECIES: ErmE/ErmH/ErmO/ErmR family 23S rRNA (adenine(2058)-N(6))-methyltransferase [unclassified Nocardiopsis]|uniref:ErmE/ErmH/ErmO/ErmR family 23S rRNA (adenine(2058)-N(6))-methyltransferase n=1 Tax=unclassified Nocardiopsis TaxID=2649073 RepID=UPI00135A6C80|nr:MULTISPECIES: ErmE/ErmH/ErmO/ErmR family 23S rRNA (adenine(2058)-N(6))-methyltransferase [unclassified Nocardiopsis]
MARTASSSRTGAGDNRRRFSQNFLTDPAWARRVVRTSGVGPDDLVVEVGPGEGALTRFLAPTARRVLAYEIDPRLAARLGERYRDPALGVRVVRADLTRVRPPREEFHVVGDIPYARTADIVRWCLDAPALASATLMTQLEYARKRTGGFGRWSRLTVLTWPEWSWSLAGRIDRRRFRPVPRVDSGLLVLRRRPVPLVARSRMGAYRRLVELGFGGAGGSVGASLRHAHPARRVDGALARAGVPPRTPVGYVSPQRWLEVFEALED